MKRDVILAGLLLLATACSNQPKEKQTVPTVRLYTVEVATGDEVAEFPGRVKAAEEVNLAFKVSGTLQQIHVEEGAHVRKGQLIAEMDPRDYQIQLQATEAEYNQIKAEAERVISLYNDSVATAEVYDKARYGLKQITAKYEHAQHQLADTKIYAPFDGYVQKRLFDPPTVVAAGMPVMMLVSGSRPEIEINIPASTYMRRGEIAACNTRFVFMPDKEVALRVISIAPKANANQLYTMRLALPQQLQTQPTPGMNTMVKISFHKEESAQVEIPSSAIFKRDNNTCVWIFQANGTVEARTIEVGSLHTNGKAIVTSGLNGGEQIVTAGVHSLSEHQQVKPMEEATETNVGGLL